MCRIAEDKAGVHCGSVQGTGWLHALMGGTQVGFENGLLLSAHLRMERTRMFRLSNGRRGCWFVACWLGVVGWGLGAVAPRAVSAGAGPTSRPEADRGGASSIRDPRSEVPNDSFWPKDSLALAQEIDTFASLEDGQPAGPGDWEMQLQGGWGTWSDTGRHDPALLEPGLKYTPHRYGPTGAQFLENMQLRMRMPFVLGTGEVTQNGDLDFGWQQRWIKESGLWPTFSTLAEIRMPTRHHSSGVDGTFTGILAKSLGPGTAYANGWVRTANGDDIDDVRHLQWGLRGGYKLPINDWASLVAVYAHSSSTVEGHGNTNVLELGASFRTKHRLSFGPGVFVGLDDRAETPNFGVGFRLIYLFNARDNPTPDQLAGLRRERHE